MCELLHTTSILSRFEPSTSSLVVSPLWIEVPRRSAIPLLAQLECSGTTGGILQPRFDGVRDFLISRCIRLPEGSPDDPPEVETVCGLGNRKNELVNKIIEDVGVEPYEGSVSFLHQLRSQGFKIAVVTSSQNCAAVLRAAKLDAFFDIRVDGNTILAEHLAGKPAPDTFLMAAKLLGPRTTISNPRLRPRSSGYCQQRWIARTDRISPMHSRHSRRYCHLRSVGAVEASAQ
jgi:hypothetical protein